MCVECHYYGSKGAHTQSASAVTASKGRVVRVPALRTHIHSHTQTHTHIQTHTSTTRSHTHHVNYHTYMLMPIQIHNTDHLTVNSLRYRARCRDTYLQARMSALAVVVGAGVRVCSGVCRRVDVLACV